MTLKLAETSVVKSRPSVPYAANLFQTGCPSCHPTISIKQSTAGKVCVMTANTSTLFAM